MIQWRSQSPGISARMALTLQMALPRQKTSISGLRRRSTTLEFAEALKDFLNRDPTPKMVGIMGGHGLSRSATSAYAAVARLARHLTQAGCLIVTSGGPGAMEAAAELADIDFVSLSTDARSQGVACGPRLFDGVRNGAALDGSRQRSIHRVT
jgi:hypothetical protein